MSFDDNIILKFNESICNADMPLFDLSKLQDELTDANLELEIDSVGEDILSLTVKQLMLVCEYYGISKGVKMCKFKKNDIMETIIMFESDLNNRDIVMKRRKRWHWLNELKTDKILKKCVIWPITN